MHITLLNPTVLLRRPIVELARHLRQRGYVVQILTPFDNHSTWKQAHFESKDVKIIYLPSKEFRSVLWSVPYLKSWRIVWRSMKETDVMHIWAPYYFVAILPLLYSFIIPNSSRPKIILTFDTIPGYSFQFTTIQDILMRIYHLCIGSWLFRRADIRTLYGGQLRSFALRAHLGSDFEIIPTGVDLGEERIISPRQGTFNVLFIGILNNRKGIAVLLGALAILQQRNLKFSATLIGEGPQRVEFEHLRDELGLGNTVQFIGRVSNVKEYYERAHVLMLPSFGEGLPGVVMEAMTYSIPVISTDIPCLRELIPNSNIGVLVKEGDVASLASAIELLYKKEPDRLRMAKAARQHIMNFSWRNIVPLYERIYGTA